MKTALRFGYDLKKLFRVEKEPERGITGAVHMSQEADFS
jgi:hypothetical protein